MRWSKEKAWSWYNARPWIRGCNYMSADCANRVDQWQSLGFEERFETTEAELKLMQETGFNTVRLILEYVVWEKEHDSFMERFERYIALCDKYGISCMIVLANDCMPPKTELWKMPDIGIQHYDWGYHGGRKHSQHGLHSQAAPHFYLDQEESRERYFQMVREIVERYKDDERICLWDLYNEAGNSRRNEMTLPNLKRLFEIVRKINPSQPLTACVWRTKRDPFSPVEQFALDNSDIITYHCYKPLEEHIKVIERLKKEERPIINTEWLDRAFGNDVFSCFPLFCKEKIGCINWGFVAGKYQTYEIKESTWQKYENGTLPDYVDFTKWVHDLYRPSHRPYDPREIELIRKYCTMADEEFKEQN